MMMKMMGPLQMFESKAELQIHTQVHMREAKPYKCTHCPKSFANSSYLSQHMRIHLGIKPFGPCQYCGRKVRLHSLLTPPPPFSPSLLPPSPVGEGGGLMEDPRVWSLKQTFSRPLGVGVVYVRGGKRHRLALACSFIWVKEGW